MIIFSEAGERLENPDLGSGWIEIRTVDTVKTHHPAVQMEYHIEERDGKRIRVIDRDAKDAWDEYEEYGVYHPYDPNRVPSDAERIDALEAQLAAYEAAYVKGVNEA